MLKCGSCRIEFLLSDIVQFIQHKTSSSCKVPEQQQYDNSNNTGNGNITSVSPGCHACENANDSTKLTCGTCPETFTNARSLLEHAQYIHKINIFLNTKTTTNKASPGASSSVNTASFMPGNNLNRTYQSTIHGGLSSSLSNETAKNKNRQQTDVFIDFMPSDKRHMDRSAPSSLYNITVSSTNNNNNNSNSSVKNNSSSISNINVGNKIINNSNIGNSSSLHITTGSINNSLITSQMQATNRCLNLGRNFNLPMRSTTNELNLNENASNMLITGNRTFCKSNNNANITSDFNTHDNSSQSSRCSSCMSTCSLDDLTQHNSNNTVEHPNNETTINLSNCQNPNPNTFRFEKSEFSSFKVVKAKNATDESTPNTSIQNTEAALSCASNNANNVNTMSKVFLLFIYNFCTYFNFCCLIFIAFDKTTKNKDSNLKLEKRKRKSLTIKPFLCDVCNAKFNQKIHLIKHSAKHTGIKPFKCTECSYSTVERSHLKVHIRIHTGEKPFKCTFCEYATAQSSTLKVHFMSFSFFFYLITSHLEIIYLNWSIMSRYIKSGIIITRTQVQ